jgi:hypothetical protein
MHPFASLVLAATATTTIFSDYPAFVNPRSVVEAYFDKGPIIEIVVKCPVGTGILSYSKLERRYCSAKHDCFPTLASATRRTCE